MEVTTKAESIYINGFDLQTYQAVKIIRDGDNIVIEFFIIKEKELHKDRLIMEKPDGN